MNPGFASRVRRQVIWMVNRIAVFLNAVRMTAFLAARLVPSRLGRRFVEIRKESSPRSIFTASVIAALIITPTTLYMIERDRHLAQKDAYRNLSFVAGSEQGFLTASLRTALAEQERLAGLVLDAGYLVQSGEKVTVKVIATGYSSSPRETDSTPFITASNTRTREGILAMSRDLLKRYTPGAPFAFGDRVHVPGLGDFLVEDSMNARWRNRIDIWFPSRVEALRFGIRQTYLTSILEESEPVEDDISSVGGAANSTTGL